MTAPPADLNDWPKPALVDEVTRLRAILREHAEQVSDAPRSGGDFVDVAGDPHAHGGVVVDSRGAVILDGVDVMLLDTKRPGEPPAAMLVLQGRVNLTTTRTRQAFLLNHDGAAAVATQLIALAGRAGGEYAKAFRDSFEQRMAEMP